MIAIDGEDVPNPGPEDRCRPETTETKTAFEG
jgi:hypothetical protein